MKYIYLGLAMLLLTSCQTKNADFYRVHPKELQQALENCSQNTAAQPDCAELRTIAIEVNRLAFDLQKNPQAFGQQIIALQTKLATLSQQESNPKTAEKIAAIKQQLAMRMSLVTWLESPEN